MKHAIDIIKAEHRALAAVLVGLQAFVDGVASGRYAVDHDLLAAMVQYITELPDKVHHPKEDLYLFAALRRRDPRIAEVLDGLEREHGDCHAKWTALATALADFRIAGPAGVPAFKAAVAAYLDFQWQHMTIEETQVLPAARAALLPEDWAAIDAAFAANDNPWEGAVGKYKALFARIVTIAPAPIGVGERVPPP